MNAPGTPRIPLLELDMLRTLVAIADTGSFSGAAAAVHRTPSAVSMQVKKLEETVGRPLFERDSRHVSPTPDGAALVAHGRRMLALNRDMAARFVTPEVSGAVRLGAPDDVTERFLPDMLRRFGDSHPGIHVTVVVGGSDRLREMVRARTLDMAVTTCDVDAPGAEILYAEPLVWAMRADGIAAEADPMPLSVWEDGCIWRRMAIAGLQGVGRDYRIAFESAHISGQKAAVLADLAVAPLPHSALDQRIVAAPPALGLPALPCYGLALELGEEAPPQARAAADHLRAAFARCCG